MSYSKIDPIINLWVKRHGLHLYTTCKDEEVRAIQITDEKGHTYGVGIEAPDACGKITIRTYAWDFKRRHKQYLVTEPELEQSLENALADIRAWMTE